MITAFSAKKRLKICPVLPENKQNRAKIEKFPVFKVNAVQPKNIFENRFTNSKASINYVGGGVWLNCAYLGQSLVGLAIGQKYIVKMDLDTLILGT